MLANSLVQTKKKLFQFSCRRGSAMWKEQIKKILTGFNNSKIGNADQQEGCNSCIGVTTKLLFKVHILFNRHQLQTSNISLDFPVDTAISQISNK